MPTDQDLKQEEASTETAAAALAALDVSDDASTIKTSEDADEDLFKKPPPKGVCPLCFLPLPIISSRSCYFACCGKTICDGCDLKDDCVRNWSNCKRALQNPPESQQENMCAFCREPIKVFTGEEHLQYYQKRMDKKDAKAFHTIASDYACGDSGLREDEEKAVELDLRAVELGSADACFIMASRYSKTGPLNSDAARERHFLELAAKRGHVDARYDLGVEEYENGNIELAVKHWMISAAAGHENALHNIGVAYRKKGATKDQFEEALRAHQKAKKDMSSFERDMAQKCHDGGGKLWVLSETELAKLSGVQKRELALFTSYYAFMKRQE